MTELKEINENNINNLIIGNQQNTQCSRKINRNQNVLNCCQNNDIL